MINYSAIIKYVNVFKFFLKIIYNCFKYYLSYKNFFLKLQQQNYKNRQFLLKRNISFFKNIFRLPYSIFSDTYYSFLVAKKIKFKNKFQKNTVIYKNINISTFFLVNSNWLRLYNFSLLRYRYKKRFTAQYDKTIEEKFANFHQRWQVILKLRGSNYLFSWIRLRKIKQKHILNFSKYEKLKKNEQYNLLKTTIRRRPQHILLNYKREDLKLINIYFIRRERCYNKSKWPRVRRYSRASFMVGIAISSIWVTSFETQFACWTPNNHALVLLKLFIWFFFLIIMLKKEFDFIFLNCHPILNIWKLLILKFNVLCYKINFFYNYLNNFLKNNIIALYFFFRSIKNYFFSRWNK